MTARRLAVVFTRRAASEIEQASSWWHDHRPAAPEAIVDEISSALELIAWQPGAGAVARSERLVGLRRVFLPRVGYFLYYRTRRRPRRIEILAFWHAQRGAGPNL